MKTIIRDARVLTMDPAGTEFARATVTIEDDLIVAVEPDAMPRPAAGGANVREIDGTGHLVMPGLVNAHFHSSANHLKGSWDSMPLEVFMLFETPADGDSIAPRAAYVSTMLGAMEMLKTGVTAVLDDPFFVPAPSPEVIDAVMQAYEDCGIRAVVALDQPNVPEVDKLPFLADLLPPDLLRRAAEPAPMDAAGLLGCYEHLIRRWHGRADGRLRAAVSCSAPQRVTRDYFHALDELSRRHALPFYVHVLETKVQRVFGEEKLGGRSLIGYVSDEGLLSERMNIIHGIWVDDADLDLIASAASVVAHNPISNLRLGSGIMPFRRLRERGIPICLGSDEAITDDSVNMWGVAKLAGLIHNITSKDYQRWPRAEEILDCLIRGGARAMRNPTPIGQIAPGHQADLILIDLDTLAFSPLNDLKRQLVYCESGTSVRMTMVAGRIVYEHGKSLLVDEPALRAEARDLFARRAPPDGGAPRGGAPHGAASEGAALGSAQRWLPYYRQMYLKAADRDVGMQRWAGDSN